MMNLFLEGLREEKVAPGLRFYRHARNLNQQSYLDRILHRSGALPNPSLTSAMPADRCPRGVCGGNVSRPWHMPIVRSRESRKHR